MAQLSTFIIVQEGRDFAPVTVQSGELLLGRDRDCDLQLPDPAIPPKLAFIKEINFRFYLYPIEPSPFDAGADAPITINGRALTGEVALATDDVLTIGICRLRLKKDGSALVIRVAYPEPSTLVSPSSPGEPSKPAPDASPAPKGRKELTTQIETPSQEAGNLVKRWLERHSWRGRRKLVLQNYLEPRLAKAEGAGFNWAPTTDLAPPWPASFLVYCLLAVCAFAAVMFFVAPFIFAPGKLSSAHTRTQASFPEPIASASTGNSCMSCHTLKGTIDQNCSHCHQAAGFHASTTRAHEASGITCISCHGEHHGADFSPKAVAFSSCATCHNDNNKQTYNGKTVHTPHGGTFGYPMSAGQWIWTGLSEEALKLKPEVAAMRLPGDTERQWRSKQFHAIHYYRVKVAAGINGVQNGVLSCWSCHTSFEKKVDREMPRQTCSKCHNGYVDGRTGTLFVAAGKPNCTSCHVQHDYDTYRWGDLLTESAQEKRRQAIGKNFIDAVNQSASR